MTNFPLDLAIGATITLNSQASFLYYESASAGGADTSIKVQDGRGAEFVLKPGQGQRFQQPFTRLFISNNKNAGRIIGNLVISDNDFVDNRTVGSVEVIDGGKARTLANSAFLGGGGAGLAGNYPHVQLWNPVGSNKNVVVESIMASSTVTNFANVRPYAVACSALIGNVGPKKIGGSNSTAEARKDTTAGILGGTILTGQYITANGQASVRFTEPVVIPPGYGLLVQGNVGTDIAVYFEFFEDPL